MPNEKDYDLDPFYLNQRRITFLAGAEVVVDNPRLRNLPEKNRALSIAAGYKRIFAGWLRNTHLPVFEGLAVSGGLKIGTVFTAFRDFTCRDVVAPRGRKEREPVVYATYDALGENGEDVRLTLRIHRDHVLPGSVGELLRGRVRDVFVVATIHEVTPTDVIAIPLFIGRKQSPGPLPMWLGSRSCEVPFDFIESFELAQTEPLPREKDLNALKGVPEAEVKRAFVEIIGEDHVPKDWGGETSDLFTPSVLLGGQRIPAAFVFKGPAKFHPMTLADLGKNGDQLVRLQTEPADLLVVQHCHRITPPVRSVLRAFCNESGRSRYCSVIDGFGTLRLLRAYSKVSAA